MSNPFAMIPPKARQWLYLAYALIGLVLGGVQVYGLSHLGSLDVGKALEVLAYVGIPLGFTAASNMPSYEDVAEGDAAPPHDDRGAADAVTVLVVVVLVLLVLFLLGFLR